MRWSGSDAVSKSAFWMRDFKERRRPGRPKLDEKGEAHLIALACSPAPDGHDHWTLRLLAGKAVELGVVDPSPTRAFSRLKKTNSPSEQGVVHSRGELVARVLDLYHED